MKTGAVGQFFVSPHAVQRYVQRIRGGRLGYDAALGELIRLTSAATKLRDLADGRELWRGPDVNLARRVLFIVVRAAEGALPVVETVPPRRHQQRAWPR